MSTPPPNKGALTAPRNALAAMNRLQSLDRPHPTPSVDTELRTYGSTEVRTAASEEVSTDGSKDLLTDVSKEVRTQVSTDDRKGALTELPNGEFPDSRTEVRKAASTEVRRSVKAGCQSETCSTMARFRAKMARHEKLEGGVKQTVEMSPELSTRIKRYLLDHRGKSGRDVAIAAIETVLELEGY